MKFVTVRDLRNKPAQIRQSLSKEKDIDVYCEKFMKRRRIVPMLG